MFIIIILAVLTQWLYPKLSTLQPKFLQLIDSSIDKIRLSIHKKAQLRKFTYSVPRWVFVIFIWSILLLIYILIHQVKWLPYIVFYLISILCINMPIQAPWKNKFKSNSIYKKWLELFSISGDDMANAQSQNKNSISIANFEECSQAMLSMWCYSFMLPLLFLALPYGDFICLSWLLLRHVCLQLKNIYLIYIIEWIPRHIILLLSAILGNFESCISNARQEKKAQRSIQDISNQDSESWLWCGIKGAINIDFINSNYHYQQFLVFLAKLVLAVAVLYIFMQFM